MCEGERVRERESVRERERVCVRERERVCVRERVRERESVRERERESVCLQCEVRDSLAFSSCLALSTASSILCWLSCLYALAAPDRAAPCSTSLVANLWKYYIKCICHVALIIMLQLDLYGRYTEL